MEYKIQNSETIQELREGARLSISEGFPERLAGSVVPVMEVNPKNFRVCNIVKDITQGASTASASTVYTTPTNKDFYLMGFNFTISKTALCDSASGSHAVSVVIGGATVNLGRITSITLEAQNIILSHDYTKPIKLDRGSTITFNNVTYTAGVCLKSCAIVGYTVEP